MKILHTSDWHLGMPVGTGSYEEEQRHFLDQLYAVIRDRNVGAVLLAGDVYDSSVSNAAAISVYNDAVTSICAELGVPMIVIAGNHDSAARLASCRTLLKASGLYVTGKLERDIEPLRYPRLRQEGELLRLPADREQQQRGRRPGQLPGP